MLNATDVNLVVCWAEPVSTTFLQAYLRDNIDMLVIKFAILVRSLMLCVHAEDI